MKAGMNRIDRVIARGGYWFLLFVATAASITAPSTAQSPIALGTPLPGLSPVEFEEFRLGLDDFLEVEATEEGLGPAFNGTSCAVCHSIPTIGGAGTMAELRAGRRLPNGEFETLDASGDTLFHSFSVPGHGCQPTLPADTNVFARRVPIPLFGAGLVEAIPDETLRDLEDPIDRNRDGVSGRAALIIDVATGQRRVGRFGWKAQHATLITFGADAYRNEMGITNDLFPHESAFGIPADRMRICDPFPDPEDRREPRTGRRGIDNFASFMRFLAPVGRGDVNDQVRAGEQVFSAIGCATCHVPALQTGPSSNPLFHYKMVPLFSDLLLHDVGTGDGIKQGAAEPNEIRTPALWGLRLRRPLLHDGNATLDDAIRRHAREAELARRGFERLSLVERAALLAFLGSL
jgi:CxxC motif-containing protein (DUF1111 family)